MAIGREPNKGVSGRRSSGGIEEGSLSSSDAEVCWHSTYGSKRGSSSCEESSRVAGGRALPESRREESSSVSESLSDADLDLESGLEMKGNLGRGDKDCRICHLSLEGGNHESGVPIELGCSCKDDLAAAHKQCAETWFKLKGNKTCEICGTTARNVVTATEPETIEQLSETSNAVAVPQAERRSFWRGHRFLNFLLACMVFAFVISWLFHFSVPS